MNLGSFAYLLGELTQEKNTVLKGLCFRTGNQRGSDGNIMTPIIVMENTAVDTNTHASAGECTSLH